MIYDVSKASAVNIDAVRDLVKGVDGRIRTLILTGSPEDQIERFRHDNQLPVEFAFTDVTVLKTIIRSNPGIALWKDGVVLGNWHHNNTPDASEVLALTGN